METIPELRSKAAELRKIAQKLDDAANALAGLGGNGEQHMSNLSPPVPARAIEPNDFAGMSGVNAIYRVLEDAGKPLWKTDLSDELRRRGKAIGENTLQSYLSRDKRFRTLGGGLWALSDRKGALLRT